MCVYVCLCVCVCVCVCVRVCVCVCVYFPVLMHVAVSSMHLWENILIWMCLLAAV